MHRILSHILLPLALAAPLLTRAQEPIFVGIPSEKFESSIAYQEQSNWCWAACIEMIFGYHGLELTQEDIVRRSYGIPPGGKLPDVVGKFEVITRNLNEWNIDSRGAAYQVRSEENWGAPEPEDLIAELKAGHPVMVGYRTGPNSGHAVLITAVSYLKTPKGPEIQTVVVRDPMPNPQNPGVAGRYEYPAYRFGRRIQAYWFVKVEKQEQVN